MTLTSTPTLRRRFSIFDPVANCNKEWMVEAIPQGDGSVVMRTTWGRVGTKGDTKDKVVASMKQVDAKIAEKTRKGYEEIDLAAPVAAGAPIQTTDKRVSDLVAFIFREAGEAIGKYLSVPVNNLSLAQIAKGRQKLAEVQSLYVGGHFQKPALVDAVIAYYKAIPTKMPSKIHTDDIVTTFLARMPDIGDELDQLEAAVSTLVPTGGTQYNTLGANIERISPGEEVYDKLVAYVTKGVDRHQFRLDDIFRVEIPHERQAFDASVGNVKCLIHATRTQYVRHILKQGMKLPTSGGDYLMFGFGIYHADVTSKSLNYAQRRGYDGPNIMFLSDVALGRQYMSGGAMYKQREPPHGYDSIMGVAKSTQTGGFNGSSTLNHNEYIVYKPNRMTIRYLITFNR